MSGEASNAGTGASFPVRAEGVSKRFGATDVLRSVDLDVPAGSMVALLGPSGCGKTTLLRILSGLEVPDEGEVRIGDDTVVGPGLFVAPERRRVGMVFQDWALFPHLTVERNVAYGLPRAERRGERVQRALAMVGLEGLGQRSPSTLSGGQQQRVALARAIAPQPSVLLLDEPFSNLDTALRVQVRTEVHELLVELGITTVFVTHDQDEAFVLGDQVAVMNDGRIVQQATPAELYSRPASRWVATFVGDANLLPGAVTAGATGPAVAHTSIGAVEVADAPAGAVEVLIRPEELELVSGSSAQVELVEFYGHDTVYLVRDGENVLRARAGSSPRFGRGDRVDVRYTGPPTVAFPASASDAASGAASAARAATRPEPVGDVPSPT